ncbi:hypothetical protein ACFL2Z_04745 [Candidatus Eisenbacteria bacterium]|uniref:Outer membrane protein beta-barrel domain-containing protein n=1 Tax=Eiseniibacteriota bacterium TaxID=2212470 RepID=A0ABV6YQ53_UNCEI
MRAILSAAIVSVLLLSGVTAHAAADLGQPAPLGRLQEFSWGLGYHNYRAEWQTEDKDVRTGILRQSNYWIQVYFTFAENWEFYTRFGVANLKIDTLFTQLDPPADYEAEYNFNLTLGMNGLLYRGPGWGIGPILQASFYADYETELEGELREGMGGVPGTVLARYQGWRDINLGIAAQVDVGPLVLYGGGFGYWTTADGHVEITGDEAGITRRQQATVDEKGNFGGYVGTRIPMGRAWSFHAEGQYKSDISFSVALSQRLSAYFD